MSMHKTIVLCLAMLSWTIAAGAAQLESEALLLDVDETTGHWSLLDQRSGQPWPSEGAASHGDVPGLGDGITLSTANEGRSLRLTGEDGAAVIFTLTADGWALEIRYEAVGDDAIRILGDLLTVTAEENGNLIMPCREGLLFEANRPTAFKRTFDTSSYEGAHMNMIGALKRGSGLIVTWDDAYTAVEIERSVGDSRRLTTTFELRRTSRSLRFWPVGPGDWNTIAAAYREIAEDKGYAVTLREKIAREPRLEQLIGAANLKLWHMYARRMNRESTEILSEEIRYSFDESVRIAEHLKNDLDIDRCLFTLGGWIKNGYDNSHPDILPANPECGGNEGLQTALRRIEELGYVTSLHDNYQDMYRNAPSYDTSFLEKKKDGSLANWGHWMGGTPDYVCAPKQIELAKRPQNLPGVKDLFSPQSYFIDTTFAAGPQECYNPEHPLDRNDDILWKTRLADYARNQFGIFGSECGREWALPHSDFFEGITGLYGRAFDEERKEEKLDATLIPFWEMVYHDCQICYGKYSCDPKAGAQGIAQHVLFARPFYYHFGGQSPKHLYWEQHCTPVDKSVGPEKWCFTPENCALARADSGWAEGMVPFDAFIKNSHEVLGPLHRATAHTRLQRLSYLDTARTVHKAVYGAGPEAVTLFVNLGAEPAEVDTQYGGQAVLPQWGFAVEAPTFTAFYALRWNGVDYGDGSLFTVTAENAGTLGKAKTARVFHGFGPQRIALRGHTYRVAREETVELR